LVVYSGDPSIFVPSHKRDIPSGEQWLIDRTAEAFLATCQWPKLDKLTRDAARANVELPDISYGMPVQDFLWRPDNEGTVVLSLTGLWRSSTGKEFVDGFLKVVLLCRDIYLGDDQDGEDGPPKITSEDLRSRLGFADAVISRIHVELRFEYFLTGGGGSNSNTDWYYFINQSVAKFRDVRTLAEYFEERAKIVAPRFASAPWPPVLVESEVISDQLVTSPTAPLADEREVDPHNVFVVFGRDTRAKDAMWQFLERLGLHPLDWNEMVRLTGKGTPYTGHVIEMGFSIALACVVLMTPDDEARLHADLLEPEDGDHERELTCQPRPNVIFEAGRAFGTHPDHTILVEVGALRPVSDLAGLNVVRIGATKAPLMALADRLEAAGCPVDRKDPDVFDPAKFAQLPSLNRKARVSDEPVPSGPRVGRVLGSQPRKSTPQLAVKLWDHGKDKLLEITNRGGVELRDIEWELVGEVPNWYIMSDALPKYPIPSLAPQKHVRVPVATAMGGPAYVDLVVRAQTEAGEPYETTEQLSIFG
jgi:predicted nucleotide-binding protein